MAFELTLLTFCPPGPPERAKSITQDSSIEARSSFLSIYASSLRGDEGSPPALCGTEDADP
jgi:hypothetical protein